TAEEQTTGHKEESWKWTFSVQENVSREYVDNMLEEMGAADQKRWNDQVLQQMDSLTVFTFNLSGKNDQSVSFQGLDGSNYSLSRDVIQQKDVQVDSNGAVVLDLEGKPIEIWTSRPVVNLNIRKETSVEALEAFLPENGGKLIDDPLKEDDDADKLRAILAVVKDGKKVDYSEVVSGESRIISFQYEGVNYRVSENLKSGKASYSETRNLTRGRIEQILASSTYLGIPAEGIKESEQVYWNQALDPANTDSETVYAMTDRGRDGLSLQWTSLDKRQSYSLSLNAKSEYENGQKHESYRWSVSVQESVTRRIANAWAAQLDRPEDIASWNGVINGVMRAGASLPAGKTLNDVLSDPVLLAELFAVIPEVNDDTVFTKVLSGGSEVVSFEGLSGSNISFTLSRDTVKMETVDGADADNLPNWEERVFTNFTMRREMSYEEMQTLVSNNRLTEDERSELSAAVTAAYGKSDFYETKSGGSTTISFDIEGITHTVVKDQSWVKNGAGVDVLQESIAYSARRNVTLAEIENLLEGTILSDADKNMLRGGLTAAAASGKEIDYIFSEGRDNQSWSFEVEGVTYRVSENTKSGKREASVDRNVTAERLRQIYEQNITSGSEELGEEELARYTAAIGSLTEQGDYNERTLMSYTQRSDGGMTLRWQGADEKKTYALNLGSEVIFDAATTAEEQTTGHKEESWKWTFSVQENVSREYVDSMIAKLPGTDQARWEQIACVEQTGGCSPKIDELTSFTMSIAGKNDRSIAFEGFDGVGYSLNMTTIQVMTTNTSGQNIWVAQEKVSLSSRRTISRTDIMAARDAGNLTEDEIIELNKALTAAAQRTDVEFTEVVTGSTRVLSFDMDGITYRLSANELSGKYRFETGQKITRARAEEIYDDSLLGDKLDPLAYALFQTNLGRAEPDAIFDLTNRGIEGLSIRWEAANERESFVLNQIHEKADDVDTTDDGIDDTIEHRYRWDLSTQSNVTKDFAATFAMGLELTEQTIFNTAIVEDTNLETTFVYSDSTTGSKTITFDGANSKKGYSVSKDITYRLENNNSWTPAVRVSFAVRQETTLAAIREAAVLLGSDDKTALLAVLDRIESENLKVDFNDLITGKNHTLSFELNGTQYQVVLFDGKIDGQTVNKANFEVSRNVTKARALELYAQNAGVALQPAEAQQLAAALDRADPKVFFSYSTTTTGGLSFSWRSSDKHDSYTLSLNAVKIKTDEQNNQNIYNQTIKTWTFNTSYEITKERLFSEAQGLTPAAGTNFSDYIQQRMNASQAFFDDEEQVAHLLQAISATVMIDGVAIADIGDRITLNQNGDQKSFSWESLNQNIRYSLSFSPKKVIENNSALTSYSVAQFSAVQSISKTTAESWKDQLKQLDRQTFQAYLDSAGPETEFELTVQGGRQSISWQSADRGISYRVSQVQLTVEGASGQPETVGQYELTAEVYLSRALVASYALPLAVDEKASFDTDFSGTTASTLFTHSLNSQGSSISWQNTARTASFSLQIQKQRFTDGTSTTQYTYSRSEYRRLTDVRNAVAPSLSTADRALLNGAFSSQDGLVLVSQSANSFSYNWEAKDGLISYSLNKTTTEFSDQSTKTDWLFSSTTKVKWAVVEALDLSGLTTSEQADFAKALAAKDPLTFASRNTSSNGVSYSWTSADGLGRFSFNQQKMTTVSGAIITDSSMSLVYSVSAAEIRSLIANGRLTDVSDAVLNQLKAAVGDPENPDSVVDSRVRFSRSESGLGINYEVVFLDNPLTTLTLSSSREEGRTFQFALEVRNVLSSAEAIVVLQNSLTTEGTGADMKAFIQEQLTLLQNDTNRGKMSYSLSQTLEGQSLSWQTSDGSKSWTLRVDTVIAGGPEANLSLRELRTGSEIDGLVTEDLMDPRNLAAYTTAKGSLKAGQALYRTYDGSTSNLSWIDSVDERNSFAVSINPKTPAGNENYKTSATFQESRTLTLTEIQSAFAEDGVIFSSMRDQDEIVALRDAISDEEVLLPAFLASSVTRVTSSGRVSYAWTFPGQSANHSVSINHDVPSDAGVPVKPKVNYSVQRRVTLNTVESKLSQIRDPEERQRAQDALTSAGYRSANFYENTSGSNISYSFATEDGLTNFTLQINTTHPDGVRATFVESRAISLSDIEAQIAKVSDIDPDGGGPDVSPRKQLLNALNLTSASNLTANDNDASLKYLTFTKIVTGVAQESFSWTSMNGLTTYSIRIIEDAPTKATFTEQQLVTAKQVVSFMEGSLTAEQKQSLLTVLGEQQAEGVSFTRSLSNGSESFSWSDLDEITSNSL
ncbi:MAG TPA: hypothetical protein DIS66_01590, partial [Candidatus Omnitrophica bacterium]|nr:hypothetical protein [Candidatus Omnitrophota bacterium]